MIRYVRASESWSVGGQSWGRRDSQSNDEEYSQSCDWQQPQRMRPNKHWMGRVTHQREAEVS